MCQGPTYRSFSVPIHCLLLLKGLHLARGSGRDEQVKSLLTQVLVLRLREHCQHPYRCDGGAGVRAFPLVPLERGGNRLTGMNDHDGGMAAAEQEDSDGVLSRGADAGPIRIAGPSWYSYDGSAPATASVRRRFCLEGASAALAGNGGHSSDHRSILRERAVLQVRLPEFGENM